MKNHKLLLITLMLLVYGSQLCVAQQEDTLKLWRPNRKPGLGIPNQPMQTKQSLMPGTLGINGLEYTPPPSKVIEDTTELTPSLSVENYLKFYYDDFLKWEKNTYGVNLDIQIFVMKNGKYLWSNGLVAPKRKPGEKAPEAPYPIHPDFIPKSPAISIPIGWKPSKHDIWFKENFSWEKRALQIMGSQVDSFGNRSIYEVKNLIRVDSILKQNKIDSAGQFSPVKVNYKKRIKQLKKNIREEAKGRLK